MELILAVLIAFLLCALAIRLLGVDPTIAFLLTVVCLFAYSVYIHGALQ